MSTFNHHDKKAMDGSGKSLNDGMECPRAIPESPAEKRVTFAADANPEATGSDQPARGRHMCDPVNSPPTPRGELPVPQGIHDSPSADTEFQEVRSWQIRSARYGHYILGWLATEAVCRDVCGRRATCPTRLHTKRNPPDDMEYHLTCVRRDIGPHLAWRHRLACRGGRVVFVDRSEAAAEWAIVVADNEGIASDQYDLPSPEVVDKIKKYLRTEEEPRWYKCIDSMI